MDDHLAMLWGRAQNGFSNGPNYDETMRPDNSPSNATAGGGMGKMSKPGNTNSSGGSSPSYSADNGSGGWTGSLGG